tara:strand:+ start:206 stop:454 length:249 start_codon:yes stop_codon:yes gene_type:complete
MKQKERTITFYAVKALLNEALTVEVELDSYTHDIESEYQAQQVAWKMLSEGMYAMPNECWDSLTHFNMAITSMRIIGVEVSQ